VILKEIFQSWIANFRKMFLKINSLPFLTLVKVSVLMKQTAFQENDGKALVLDRIKIFLDFLWIFLRENVQKIIIHSEDI
jgi:hypothetical protein